MDILGRKEFEAAADVIRKRTKHEPKIGLVLGSGLGGLAEAVEEADIIEYPDLPHWPVSTVVGHSGRLVIGRLEGQPVLVMQGRAHYYEGYSMHELTFPVRVMQMLGIEILMLTNAAGGINASYRRGDLMLLNDHLGPLMMMGPNPLRGPNDDSLGPRFPDMSRSYDRELRQLAQQVAAEEGFELHNGVYVNLSGPSFETPADIRALRVMGADAVGMSTVPEVVVARHAGIRVMAVSGITNETIDEIDTDRETTHEEVLETGDIVVPKLTALIRGVLRKLSEAS
jgi:purine-nucleoside phosphorylase